MDARTAAFGPEPGAPVRVRPGAQPLERWQVAVALGAQGHYAAAAAVLQDLLVRPRVPVAVAAHAAVTRAAHRRQLGGHAAARPFDALGLRLASTVTAHRTDEDGGDPLAARIDALVGLAADALGTGALATAQRLLETAEDAGRSHPSWRPAVRAGWVRAELALVRGEAAAAVGPARGALDLALRGGSVRHVLKSRIVLAVASAVAGRDPAAALAELDGAAGEAERHGLLPLVWPARLAAADLLDRLSGAARTANDGAPRTAQRPMNTRSSDATRRRHAAITTLSVIERRCDPVGRRLMGESMWLLLGSR